MIQWSNRKQMQHKKKKENRWRIYYWHEKSTICLMPWRNYSFMINLGLARRVVSLSMNPVFLLGTTPLIVCIVRMWWCVRYRLQCIRNEVTKNQIDLKVWLIAYNKLFQLKVWVPKVLFDNWIFSGRALVFRLPTCHCDTVGIHKWGNQDWHFEIL